MKNLVLVVYIVLTTVGAFTGGIWAAGGIGLALIAFGVACVVYKKTYATNGAAPTAWAEPTGSALSPDRGLLGGAVLALGIMALLNLGSSYPAISWHLWLNLLTIFVPLTLLSVPLVQGLAFPAEPSHGWSLIKILPMSLMVGAAALGIELQHGGFLLHHVKNAATPLSDYNRGMSFLVLMAFPALACLWFFPPFRRGGWLIVPFLLLLLYPAGLTESRTAKLALVAGLGLTLVAWRAPRLVAGMLAAALVPLMGWAFAARWFFLNHFAALDHFPPSWRARMEIWDYMSYRIAEHPWLGSGLGVAHKLDFTQPHGAAYVYTLVPASHPHNVFTELWVELGLPGLMLGLMLGFYSLRLCLRLAPSLRPLALGAWGAALCIVLVGFDFWTDSNQAAFALTAFAFVAINRRLARAAVA